MSLRGRFPRAQRQSMLCHPRRWRVKQSVKDVMRPQWGLPQDMTLDSERLHLRGEMRQHARPAMFMKEYLHYWEI